jgi:hypothetical protein
MWDFSSSGSKLGVKSFFIGILKFALAVGVAAILKQLLLDVSYVAAHLNTSNDHYGLLLSLTGFARAAISGFLDWVNTNQADPTVVVPTVEAASVEAPAANPDSSMFSVG